MCQGPTACWTCQSKLRLFPEDERSGLQQLGDRASKAVSRAAENVKDVFTEIDDNVLEYCSLDAKVPVLLELCTTSCWPSIALQILSWCAGWQANVQDDLGSKGTRISGSFEGKLLSAVTLLLLNPFSNKPCTYMS